MIKSSQIKKYASYIKSCNKISRYFYWSPMQNNITTLHRKPISLLFIGVELWRNTLVKQRQTIF